MKLTNALGAIRTSLNIGTNEGLDSDLRSVGTTVSFNLASFDGEVFDKIDIGLLRPKDRQVKVWEDVNGNGIQEDSWLTAKTTSLVTSEEAAPAI